MASNYNGIYVKLSSDNGGTWTVLPTPSDYDFDVRDLVDSARNSDGKVVAQVIRKNVKRIDCTWNILSQAQFTTIMAFVDAHFSFLCYFYNTHTGTYESVEMYVGNRKDKMAKTHIQFDANNEIINTSVFYEGVKLAFIEV